MHHSGRVAGPTYGLLRQISTRSAINKGLRSTTFANNSESPRGNASKRNDSFYESRGIARQRESVQEAPRSKRFGRSQLSGRSNRDDVKPFRAYPRNDERVVHSKIEKNFQADRFRRFGGHNEDAERSGTRPRSSINDDEGSSQRLPKQRIKADDADVPIEYTTAASQFIYGANVVIAALMARRRKLYKLYVNRSLVNADSEIASEASDRVAQKVLALAKQAGIKIREQADPHLLDRLSGHRRHNGVVLEASPLPAPPVLSLGKVDKKKNMISIELAHQSAEDAIVNSANGSIPHTAHKTRAPFIVMLDGITDPGNVGNIIRTCHFYGVDAVAIATNTCANNSSPVLVKSSSGACEAMQILALPKPSSFVYESLKQGWAVFAAVAPPSTPKRMKEASDVLTSTELAADSPLKAQPCILMLGAEGEGLRKNLLARASHRVTVAAGKQGSPGDNVGVDSLNVGVAAGVLIDAFMRDPALHSEIAKSRPGELGF